MTTAATPPFFFDVPLSAVSDSLVDFSSTVEISSSEESRSEGTAAGTGPEFKIKFLKSNINSNNLNETTKVFQNKISY